MHKTLSTHDFKQLLDSWDFDLIDVRTPGELMEHGVISKNQIHIDISQSNAVSKIQKLDTTKKYLIYCWHWVRSKQVWEYMNSEWFTEVYDLEGGIDAWDN